MNVRQDQPIDLLTLPVATNVAVSGGGQTVIVTITGKEVLFPAPEMAGVINTKLTLEGYLIESVVPRELAIGRQFVAHDSATGIIRFRIETLTTTTPPPLPQPETSVDLGTLRAGQYVTLTLADSLQVAICQTESTTVNPRSVEGVMVWGVTTPRPIAWVMPRVITPGVVLVIDGKHAGTVQRIGS